MNREIKFRAWDTDAKKMLYGEDLYDTAQGYIGLDAETGKFYEYQCHGDLDMDREELENLIPLQYTGLKDKNGKDIYEGDYLKQEGLWVKVTWSEFDVGFVFEDESGSCMFITKGNVHNWEIDGNIYENPELIK